MRKYFSVILFVLLVMLIIGFVRRSYYRNVKSPLHTELELAASFGEIRPDHFHMGLDIRTNGKENLPVYAVEEGVISLVKIDPYGYGKAIFLQHANGKTSVYAHLNRFTDAVDDYVKQQQYVRHAWQQDIACSFAVQKGELIGYSGNTGRSEGPHLHFELRDTRTGNNLNPSLYGYAIADNTPPSIQGLYWYDRRYSTYEQGPIPIAIEDKNGEYRSKRKVVKVSSPLVSLGIRSEDRVDDSKFRYGIYRSQVWVDDVLIHDYVMNDFADSDSRYVNACIDYSYHISSGLTVQHLSKLPGNRLPVFKVGDGLIRLNDTLQHQVRIVMSDVSGNEADLDFIIQRGNYDRVVHTANLLKPGVNNVVRSDNAEVYFDKDAFYDAVPFVIKEKWNVVSLHKATVPVHSRYLVKLKTTLRKNDPLREKTVMLFTGFKNKTIIKGEWKGDYLCGKPDELGTVQLVVDTIVPEVEFSQDAHSVSITVKDNLGEVPGFKAELDGKWVLFEQKGSIYTYYFDDHCKSGQHELSVTVSDTAGNQVIKKSRFKTATD